MKTIELCPVDFSEANAFVAQYHRHHGAVVGAKFCIGVMNVAQGCICGVAIVGRPVARLADDGWTLEVTRLCVGPQATVEDCVASKLYAACRRATFALGYKRLITYILKSEPGTSLRAAGWKCLGEAGGGSWNHPGRPRVDKHPTQLKLKWEAGVVGLHILLLNAWAAQAAPSRAGTPCPVSVAGLAVARRHTPATRSASSLANALPNASHSRGNAPNFNDLSKNRVAYASWYSNASARREGTCRVGKHGGCLMANGKELDDGALTAASWEFEFGTILHVCNQRNAKCVNIVVSDRGPNKRLVRQGRIIDLSRHAFESISPLTIGIIPVTVEVKQ